MRVTSGFHSVDDEGWNVLTFRRRLLPLSSREKNSNYYQTVERKNCDKMRRRISTQTFAAVKLFRIRYFPNVNRDGSLNTKVSWLWIICFLVIITSYNTPFFTDSSLSYLHQALHFLSSHYKVSPCSFLPFLHHLSSLFSYLFSLSLFMSPVYIWGTKYGTYRLSIKEDVVLRCKLLKRLEKLWNMHYVMKSYTRMF